MTGLAHFCSIILYQAYKVSSYCKMIDLRLHINRADASPVLTSLLLQIQ